MSEVRNFLVQFVTEELELPPGDVNDLSELVADLGFDSLSFALGVSEIKERFGVVLSKEDVYECKTLGAFVDLVENRRLTEAGVVSGSPGPT